jgi:flagellar basal-body rod modification protein FlgD
MTTVDTSVSQAASGTSGTDAAAQPSLIGADYNMFLKLLTVQMQNQDPLDPMDTSQYTQQLVQFSQVEQSMQQTSSLKDILARLSSQGVAQASSYIGREARFDSPVAGLGAAPATWTYVTTATPDSLKVTVTDADGDVVHEETLDPRTQGRYSWDGTQDDGTKAADGAYTLAVTALDGNGQALPVTVNSVGIVKEVVTDGSNVILNVNGLRLPIDGLVAVAAAQDG